MIVSPFRIFEPFSDRITIKMLTKEDAVKSDEDAMKILGLTNAATIKQIHSNRTIITRAAGLSQTEADGMVTDQRDLLLMTRAADCQLFVVYAPEKNVMGTFHAGWKGLLAGAISEFYAVVKNEWGIDAIDTVVAASPSLCQNCSEFSDPIRELPGLDPTFFNQRLVDLRGIADEEFMHLGVKREHLERHPDCTKCHRDRYWSYRGEKDAVIAGYRNMLICSLK